MIHERAFVSGGAGVIGLELVPRLLARGASVWVGDLKPRPAAFPAQVRYRRGDLNSLTEHEVASFAPTMFFHLAATFERSVETYDFWDENFWNNVRLSHHLMTLLRAQESLRRVVFASSYLTYDQNLYQFPTPQEAPAVLREDAPLQPRNPTGAAKLAHEVELEFLSQFAQTRFTAVSARIFRSYGLGSRDVISRWIRSALAGEHLHVFRPEGLFDYVFAGDVAEGLVRLAIARDVTGIVNLGRGRSRRVAEVVTILQHHFEGLETVRTDTDVPFEASLADMARFEAELSWRPKTDLEEAIPAMIAYERSARDHTVIRRELPNVLVCSAASKVALVQSVVEAAHRIDPRIKVFAGDANDAALARYVADAFLVTPPTAAENASALLELCLEHGIGVVIPTRDGELAFWAENALLFQEAGITVIVSPKDTVALCVDKKAFSEHGVRHGLPIIPAVHVTDEARRFVVKERFGAGSAAIGLNLAAEAARSHAGKLHEAIYQPYIEGIESSVDAWLDAESSLKGLVARRRDLVRSGESVITTTHRSKRLESACRQVLNSMHFRGPVIVQAIEDHEGGVHVIEVNARVGGASTASIAAGLDIWFWTLFEVWGGEVSELPFDRSDREVTQVRVPTDIHFHGTGV